MVRLDKLHSIHLACQCACGRKRAVRLERLTTREMDEEQVAFWQDEAKRDGWVVGKQGDLCPTCQPEGMTCSSP